MSRRSNWTVREVKTHVLSRDDFDYVALLADVAFFLASEAPGDEGRVTVLSINFSSHLAWDECPSQCKRAEGISATVFYDVMPEDV